MFRLHIDFPLYESEELSIKKAQQITELLELALHGNNNVLTGLSMFQFKLSKDEDRRNANYMDKDTNGHVSQKKIKVIL